MKGVAFGNYHSWNDFSLILSSKSIGVPETKTMTVEIPGADGVLDVSEYFGKVNYNNRKLSFEFTSIVPQSEFANLFSEIQNAIHGKKVRIILDDDPDFYYIGRIFVKEWKVKKSIGKITVECDCEPYKYKIYKTIVNVPVSNTETVILQNLRKFVVPTFTTDATIQIQFESTTYSFSGSGTFTVPGIVLKEGTNRLSFTGNANVTIEYQEGGL